jgi:hypothetical protein
MSLNQVSIQDAGSCISIAFNSNAVLLNKPQISIVEVVKADTVRIEMGSGTTSNIFIRSTDVIVPVVANANALRDAIKAMLTTVAASGGSDDCACAPLIQTTNTQLQNVVTKVTEGNSKADTAIQVNTGVYNNGVTLNQLVTDNNAANISKLGEVKAEVVSTRASINNGNVKLDSINQSVAGTSANIIATNQLLSNNQIDSIQKLVDIKVGVDGLKTLVGTSNDQLITSNQSMTGVSANTLAGSQSLSSLDNKIGNNGFLGNVSRKAKTITVQPPISIQAYAVGQVIGGVMTLTGALRAAILSGTLMGIQVVEKSTQKAPMDIVIFSQNPTAANFADRTAPVWTNDYGNIISITNLVAANYSTLSASAGACLGNLYKKVTGLNTNLYAVAICNGTPTYASVSHLYFTFFFEQD